jgi:hypothetical protein
MLKTVEAVPVVAVPVLVTTEILDMTVDTVSVEVLWLLATSKRLRGKST